MIKAREDEAVCTNYTANCHFPVLFQQFYAFSPTWGSEVWGAHLHFQSYLNGFRRTAGDISMLCLVFIHV